MNPEGLPSLPTPLLVTPCDWPVVTASQAKGLTDPSKRDSRERYCDVGDRMCEMGRMGQKTNKGWYRYGAH